MFLVVDINVVLSALIGRGNSSIIFELNAEKKMFRFIAPQFILIEAGKHLVEIARRSALPMEEIAEDINFIKEQITFISEEDYDDKNDEARKILRNHEKDVPYLALALKYNCKIFSGDKTLKAIIPDKVLTPKEMLESFG